MERINTLIEGYAIHYTIHRSEQTGVDARGRKIYRYITEYKTDNGIFEPGEWKQKTMDAIRAAEETEILEKIKQYCKKHCFWLRKETELEEYAMDCLVHRSYLKWNNFKK